MASSPPIKTQHPTSITTAASESPPVIQEDAQRISRNATANALLQPFVGSSDPGDRKTALEFFNQVLDVAINFKAQAEVRRKQVEIPVSQSFGTMPEDGMSCKELLDCFQEISEHSTNFASPKFMGFPDAANSIPALGAAIFIPFINQNMCNQSIQAPAASFIEMEVVHCKC
jgi:hypothetical protein